MGLTSFPKMMIVDDDEDVKMMIIEKMKTVTARQSACHGLLTLPRSSFFINYSMQP